MRNSLLGLVSAERQDHPQELRPDRPYDLDPPAPSQIFTRLGVLLVIALGFGLAAELLAQLPPH